jgi:UDP-N-acetylmuramoylalanine--D-glutamate ligase
MTIDARHPLPGSRPLVVGLARSGAAAARLLVRHGLAVRACDRREASSAPAVAAELASLGVDAHWGRDDPGLLRDADVLVWSPGIPATHPLAAAARGRSVPVLSELELGFLAARAPMVCITGTNGKSTVTHLTGELIAAAGREVAVCGNIGRPVCDVAESVSPRGLLVAEVSSFQLETVERLKPHVATWLNLTPDHLDRHGTLEAYAGLKQRLFSRQDENDWSVWNLDDPEVASRRTGAGTALEFSRVRAVAEGASVRDGDIVLAWRGGTERVLPARELRIPGRHNLANALAALATTLPLEIPPDTLRATLRQYAGLEHRLEPAGEVEGVRFVNDSKATNTGSLEVALESFDEPLVLIAGGLTKDQDFRPLAPQVARRARHVVLIGEGADAIARAWPEAPATRAGSLGEAVEQALDHARAAGARLVLLSPGCASFDMFHDFEDRGRRFKDEVARLRTRGAHA